MTPPLPPEIAARRREIRDAVQRRAAHLRRTRALIVAVPIVVVVGAASWLATSGSSPTRIDVAGRTATTHVDATTGTATATRETVASRRTSTRGAATTTSIKAGPTTTHATNPRGSTAPGQPSPTTTPQVAPTSFDTSMCHNSYDPRCGSFSWQPAAPANHGLAVTVAVSDVAPTVGEVVTMTIDASDADAVPSCVVATFAGHAVALTDSAGRGVGCNPPLCPGPTRYGPWSPPAPAGGSRRLYGSFTAAAPGSQRLAVAAGSGSGCTYLPYGSSASTGVTIAVQPPPPTTTTPTT